MKAIIYTEYGPPEVLRLAEVKKTVPRDNEILVRVHATPVSFGDMLVRDLRAVSPKKFHMPFLFWLIAKIYFGFRKPRIAILGSEFAGEVEAVGRNVRRFQPGDAVFGFLGQRMGAYAEYLRMPENGVVAKKPANMSYEEAAAVPYGALMALSLCGKVELLPGQRVLVIGASGGIGPAVVQLAKFKGANVTGVCGTPRLGYVRSLGADRVIDYAEENFMDSGETYDVIFDILGKMPFAGIRRSLAPNGRCLLVSFKMKQLFQMLRTSCIGDRKVVCALATERAEDLALIKDLVEAGKFKAVIDRCFPLAQAAAAHAYVMQGHRKGSVVIAMENSGGANAGQ
ncbi:MAG TPA: NAD(P)-dependent alcohol dehydrogenase [Candidatus Aminicenantes bacterium]|nr:NAD(P)-dependent alcohol dehydrogenase [Candidatus Aminicenantes bacterium]